MSTVFKGIVQRGFTLFLVLLFTWLLWGAICSESAFAADGTIYIVNTEEGLNIRTKAAGNAKIIRAISYGTKVRRIGRSGNWLHVKTERGDVGYCYAKYLTPFGYPLSDPDDKPVKDHEKCYVDTYGKAKVYKSASSRSKVVGRVSDGTPVKLLAYRGKWALIENRDSGKRGFIQMRYLRKA